MIIKNQDSTTDGARLTSGELLAELQNIADQLYQWVDESLNDGWSTHQVEPMRRKAGEINQLLARYRRS